MVHCKSCSMYKMCTWNNIPLVGDINAPIKFLLPYTTNVSTGDMTQDDSVFFLKTIIDSMDLDLNNRENNYKSNTLYNIDMLVRCGLVSVQELVQNPDTLSKCTQEHLNIGNTQLLFLVGKDAVSYYLSAYLDKWMLPEDLILNESDVLKLFFAIDPHLFNIYCKNKLLYTDIQIKDLADGYKKVELSSIQYKKYTTNKGITICPIQHPYQIKRVDTAFYNNYYRSSIGSVIDSIIPKVDRVYRVVHDRNINTVRDLFNKIHVQDDILVSIDIETNGLHFKSNDCKVSAIQISYREDEGHLILFDHEESKFSFDDKEEIVRLLKGITHLPVVGQNFIYDYSVLYCQLGIAFNNIEWDTLLAEHFILGGDGADVGVLGLEYMSAKYLSIFKFKDEMNAYKKRYNTINKLSTSSYEFMMSVPVGILSRYGIDDTINTLRIAKKQMEFMSNYRGKDRIDIFKKLSLYKYVAFCHMSINGLYYDPIRVNELSVLYKKHLAGLITKLHKHPLVIEYRNKYLSRSRYISKKEASGDDTFIKVRIPYTCCKHCSHEKFHDTSLLKEDKTQCPQCKERCDFNKERAKVYTIVCKCGYNNVVERKPKVFMGLDKCLCGKDHPIKTKDFYTVDGSVSVEKLYKVFSPDSGSTLTGFVYDFLKTPVLSRSGKKTVDKTERPYIEAYWRDKGREDVLSFFKLYDEYKTETKLYSSYIQNIYKPTVYTYPLLGSFYKQKFTKYKKENPNLIHPAIKVYGTKTGRPSCGGNNEGE